MVELRLLHVEDQADMRDIARFALEDEGFELLLCASVVEAVDKAADFRPHLKLLDVMMPGMDGKTTPRNLPKIAGLEHVTVIFLTTKVKQDESEELNSYGTADAIPKPFDPLVLTGQVQMIGGECHN